MWYVNYFSLRFFKRKRKQAYKPGAHSGGSLCSVPSPPLPQAPDGRGDFLFVTMSMLVHCRNEPGVDEKMISSIFIVP